MLKQSDITPHSKGGCWDEEDTFVEAKKKGKRRKKRRENVELKKPTLKNTNNVKSIFPCLLVSNHYLTATSSFH